MPKGKYTRSTRPAIFPIGPSIAYIVLTREMFSCVDWDDAIWLQDRKWNAHRATNGFYACSHDPSDHKRYDSMQSVILGVRGSEVTVDHVISEMMLDNRRANLRLASRSEQTTNRRMFSNNKSGYKGVCFHKRTGRWQANIQVDGVFMYLGLRKTPELAYALYCEAAAKYHGDFARVA